MTRKQGARRITHYGANHTGRMTRKDRMRKHEAYNKKMEEYKEYSLETLKELEELGAVRGIYRIALMHSIRMKEQEKRQEDVSELRDSSESENGTEGDSDQKEVAESENLSGHRGQGEVAQT